MPANLSDGESQHESIDEPEEVTENATIAKAENIAHQKSKIQQKQPDVQSQSKEISLAAVNEQALRKLAVSLKLGGGASKDTVVANQKFQYVINYIMNGSKITKAQMSTLSGSIVLDTQLKRWEEQW